ncbi:hypothetical protein H4R99_007470 [Coemansia sp. RSA 1722]|nr:hypothetical protein IWW45_008922 [Coemansia sp. RSA 485]KAJ2589417.1 hypothetical protein H4R99_007470 [Coemansia sp. RSA 1722]KAJ2600187.1 hypothetical protein GGF39_001892 [Coemansia sp. RSA 1721]
MGFRKAKKSGGKARQVPGQEDNKVERDLDPTKKVLSGGGKVAKRGSRNPSDAPKSFQFIMQLMEMKKSNDEARRAQKKSDQKKQQKQKDKVGPRVINQELKLMPGEDMREFNQRVREKLENNMQMINSGFVLKNDKAKLNPSRDDGDDTAVSKRTERKRKNDAVRKQRKLAKKNKKRGLDSDDDNDHDNMRVQGPKFGEQAQAPPVFKALPKETFKKTVPLPNSKEASAAAERKEEMAVKQMIQRTARLSPLERMQAKRKARLEGGSAAEKRIMEAEREQAIRRYRMLRVARESAKNK